MKKNWALLIVLLSTGASAQQNSHVLAEPGAVGGGGVFRAAGSLDQAFNYNVFYDDERQLTDLSTGVNPTLEYGVRGKSVGVKAKAEGRYEKFYKYPVQDHFDYGAKVEVPLAAESGAEVKAAAEYRAFSDRAQTVDGKRYGRTQALGIIDGSLPIAATKRLGFHGTALLDSYAEPEQERLNRLGIEGVGFYEQNFLPETRWFVRGTGGLVDYPSGQVSKEIFDGVQRKFNSFFAMGELGVRGRLTERSMVDAALGYQIRAYEDESQTRFSEPVFYVQFTEQMNRRDQLMGGFNYVVQEGTWSNYHTDQEIFIGFGRLVGDQLLLLSRFSYAYRTYSPNYRRDDQRLMASVSGSYSLGRSIKLTADFYADIVNTDAFDNSPGHAALPDKSASYKAGRFSIGIIGEL